MCDRASLPRRAYTAASTRTHYHFITSACVSLACPPFSVVFLPFSPSPTFCR
jgi:hypothetical protein